MFQSKFLSLAVFLGATVAANAYQLNKVSLNPEHLKIPCGGTASVTVTVEGGGGILGGGAGNKLQIWSGTTIFASKLGEVQFGVQPRNFRDENNQLLQGVRGIFNLTFSCSGDCTTVTLPGGNTVTSGTTVYLYAKANDQNTDTSPYAALTVECVPEPVTLTVFALGGVAVFSRRKR